MNWLKELKKLISKEKCNPKTKTLAISDRIQTMYDKLEFIHRYSGSDIVEKYSISPKYTGDSYCFLCYKRQGVNTFTYFYIPSKGNAIYYSDTPYVQQGDIIKPLEKLISFVWGIKIDNYTNNVTLKPCPLPNDLKAFEIDYILGDLEFEIENRYRVTLKLYKKHQEQEKYFE